MDGIEHLILSGFKSYLGEKKIKGMLIEINENFKEQFNFVLEIMKKNGFRFSQKKRNEEMFSEGKFKKVYNYFHTVNFMCLRAFCCQVPQTRDLINKLIKLQVRNFR